MTDLNSVLLNIIFVLGAVFILAALYVLLKASRRIDELKTEISNLNKEIFPLITRVSNLTAEATSTLVEVQKHKERIEESVEKIAAIADNAHGLYMTLHREVEPTVMETARIAGGIGRALRAFRESWRNSHAQ